MWREVEGAGLLPSGEAVGINWSQSMSRQTFIGALRFDIARIGLVSRRYCGHSFRAGGATDLFASDGLLRCGELTSGRRGKHIKLRPGEKGGFQLRLGRTKTGRTGAGPKVPYLGQGPGSAAALERKWRRNTGRGPGRPEEFWLPELILLPSGEAVGIDWSRSMSQQTFIGALRFDIARIGLDPRRYCGHSFRAGGATDLFASGRMTHAEVMVMGRWKSLAAALVCFRADLDAARKSAQVFEEASAEYAAGKGARAARGA